jgi:hypothetical protein
MLNHIQNIISQSVKSNYFAKAYNDVRLSNGKLISYNADGTNGEFTGIQDVKENYFYIRVITDATATDERVSSCGNNVMQANLRLVCVFWNDNVYSASNFVTSRLKASINRLKINSVIVDYDTIWNNEMPGVEIKRYNGLNVISIDFNVKFNYKQIIADSPCKVDECEPTKICKDGFVIIKDEQGNIILEQIVPSGATVEKTINISCADATANLFDTNGNLLSTTPIASGATEPIIAPDATILINGDNSFPTIPSGGLENIVVENTAGTPVGAYDGNTNSWVTPDITVTDSDGNTFQQPSVTNVTCTPPVKSLFLKGIFAAGNDTMQSITIDADNAGTYTTLTQDGSSGTITFTVNASPATLPFTLNIGDTLIATRSIFANAGFYKITGTFV